MLLEWGQAANDCRDGGLSSFEALEPMLVEWPSHILFTQVQASGAECVSSRLGICRASACKFAGDSPAGVRSLH